MTLLSHLLLLFLMVLTVLSEKTRAGRKGIIQSREKIVVARDDGTGLTEVPPAEYFLAWNTSQPALLPPLPPRWGVRQGLDINEHKEAWMWQLLITDNCGSEDAKIVTAMPKRSNWSA